MPLALALAALIIAVPFARTNIELHSLVPFDLSPDALAAKVREMAAGFGYKALPVDRKYDLHWDSDRILNVAKQAKSVDQARRLFDAESPLLLGYRESPLPLVSLPDGEITETRPAPVISGMIEAWVSSKGELRMFHAVPPQVNGADSAPGGPVDVALLSRAIGFDISQWPEAPPRFSPLYAYDWVKAWKGEHPVLHTAITVQAAAWHGRLVDLQVLWPWSKPWHEPSSYASSWTGAARTLVERCTMGLVFLFSVFMAARNLKAGRGDRRGALRLAAAILLMEVAVWICTVHWAVDISMLNIFTTNAAAWVMSAITIWVLYIALEPAVRARWPHAMLTWSRVLTGRWQDARVAADVLYGALVGLIIAVFFLAVQSVQVHQGSVGPSVNSDVGASARYLIADVLGTASNATEFGLVVVFAIFCFRAIFRKDWAASMAAAVLFTLAEKDAWQGNLGNFAFFLIIFALLVFVLLRLGLVSTMVAIFVVNNLLRTPGAQNLTKPYEWTVIIYPATVLAIIVWAFWQTSGQQLMAIPEDDR